MSASYDTPHFIALVPDTAVSILNNFSANEFFAPAMVVLANGLDRSICNQYKNMSPLLGTYCVDQLSKALLKEQWNTLWEYSKGEEMEPVSNIDVQYLLEPEKLVALPTLFFSRQYGEVHKALSAVFNCTDLEQECVGLQWRNVLRLSAMRIAVEQISSYKDISIAELYSQVYNTEIHRPILSVVITFPGISKK